MGRSRGKNEWVPFKVHVYISEQIHVLHELHIYRVEIFGNLFDLDMDDIKRRTWLVSEGQWHLELMFTTFCA